MSSDSLYILNHTSHYEHKATDMDYLEAKAKSTALWDAYKAASAELLRVRGTECGPLGLTPDHMKAGEAFQLAAGRAKQAWAELVQFNAEFNRRFKGEIRADNKGRRS